MKNTLLFTLLSISLTGCGTINRPAHEVNANIPKDVTAIEFPNKTISESNDPVNEYTQENISNYLKVTPLESSDELPNFKLKELSFSDASISDVFTLINTEHPLSYSIERTVDGVVAQGNTLRGDKLSGDFKEVLENLSNSMGFFYTYKNKVLYIKPDMQFIVTFPPSADLLDSSAETIENLGGGNVNLNKPSGIITFTATKPIFNLINNYLKYIKETRSVVSYDTWIYEVKLSDSQETGIQWNKFSLEKGNNSTGLTGTSRMTNPSPMGLSLIFSKGYFSLDALVQFLQTQGNLKTLSQPKLAVLTGEKGTIKAGRKITYVSQVTQTPGVAGSAPTSSATTSTLQLGTDLTLTPNIDEGTIYSKIELKVDDLNQLAVNNVFGSQITLPDTISREIQTVVRSRPGDTIILGGVSTSRDLSNKEGLPIGSAILPNHANRTNERSELVIVLKPQIIKFKGL